MGFNKDDYYCSGGSVVLNEDWTSVTKFDTSSFYNWEQDNEPIYDLEDRTDLLWSKSGFPTSSLQNTGVSLVVSATNPLGVPNVYSTVQEAVDAIPDTVRFPVQIEIAASGELGSLNIRDLEFEDGGCLEIVNRLGCRQFSKQVNASAGSVYTARDSDGYITAISPYEVADYMTQVSAVSLSSLLPQGNFETYLRVLVKAPPFMNGALPGGRQLTYADESNLTLNIGTSSITLSPYEGYGEDPTIADDLVIQNVTTASSIERLNLNSIGLNNGLYYANKFNSVSVINCNGPIYLRNFLIDGASGTGSTFEHYVDNGFTVRNSDVLIENSAAIRCRVSGFNFIDSSVILSRGCVAYRIYDVDKGETRRDHFTDSAGLRASNSTITVSSTGDAIDDGTIDTNQYAVGNDVFISFTRCQNGVVLVNSTLQGGRSRLSLEQEALFSGIGNNSRNSNIISIGQNTAFGLKCINSTVIPKARIEAYENYTGIYGENSVLRLNEFNIDRNQKYGINLKNSNLTYNPDLLPVIGANTPLNGQFSFLLNGTHLRLDNSQYVPVISNTVLNSNYITSSLSGIPQLYGNTTFEAAFDSQETGTGRTSYPAIQIDNNSIARFIQTKMLLDTNSFDATRGVKGALVSITNNSTADFLGTASGVTQCLGASSYDKQKRVAGIYAGRNSVANFYGPTVIAQFGIDVLAEDNSIMSFLPHDDKDAWVLSDKLNHTSVELHSTRACLVANRESVINMEDLGDYHAYWSSSIQELLVQNGASSIADYNSDDSLDKESTTSGGWMQFYPNPQEGNPNYALDLPQVASGTATVSIANVTTKYLKEPLNPAEDHHDYSFGGVCVRAVGNSLVNVKNVHFPSGWVNASGIYYDMSGLECNNLYIWNIADESTLKASYCSVSGQWPGDAGYNGPSSVYFDGAGLPASSAPDSTPHTASLSVLDSFGASAVNGYGKSTIDNKGPFRIYFSPRSSAKFIGPVEGGEVITGPYYQILSQGYNPSGDASSTVSGTWNDSGYIYQELYPELKEPDGITSDASSFFYVSSMVDPSYVNRIRLDDSAMNTFANAKNATLGTSGRLKLVTYYRATKLQDGEGYDSDAARFGLGFLSANEFDLDRDN